MRPYLTERGRAVAALAALLALLGPTFVRWEFFLAGALLFGLLGGSWFWILHLRNQVAAAHLQLAWNLSGSEGERTLQPGVLATLSLRIQNLSGSAYGLVVIEPVCGAGLSCGEPIRVRIPARSEVHATVSLRVLAVGRWAIHGFRLLFGDPLGLLACEAYYPRTQLLEIPPLWRQARAALASTAGSLGSGRLHERLPGSSEEFLEVREYRPGDPFKRMAWKHTARTGRPMVREHEVTTSSSFLLVLDVAPSMQEGVIGRRKLDVAIRYAAQMAHAAVASGAAVGLSMVDGSAARTLPPKRGSRHLDAIRRELTTLPTLVSAQATDPLPEELLDTVAEYMRLHDRMDSRLGPEAAGPGVLQGARFKHSKLVLESWMTRCLREAPDWLLDTGSRLDSDPFMARLRLCCLARGIELPQRVVVSVGWDRKVLRVAFEEAAHFSMPTQVHVVSDLLHENIDKETRAALERALKRGHEIVVLVPYPPLLAERPSDPWGAAAYDILAEREAQRILNPIRRLRRFGLAVYLLDGSARAVRLRGSRAHGARPRSPGTRLAAS